MAVPEDLIEEFFVRLLAADPASLVRAALVCKPWRRLISSPRFRRRFCEFHRTPPMLGFLANTSKGPRFVSTSSFRPPDLAEYDPECLRLTGYGRWQVLDVRHGCVLLRSTDMDSGTGSPRLMVWIPVTNEWRKLPLLSLSATNWNAAVLCAASGSNDCNDCDHLDCQCGQPFLVVLMATAAVTMQSTLTIYSSESGAWSKPRPLPICNNIKVAPTALVGATLYFYWSSRILGYDLATGETCVFSSPPGSGAGDRVLLTTEDGGLGLASVVILMRHSREVRVSVRFSLWSMETGPDGDIGWAQIRVVEKRLPVKVWSGLGHVGFAPGLLFFNTVDGLFSVNLISDEVKNELANDEIRVTKVVPYMSFYTPAPGLTITDKGPASG